MRTILLVIALLLLGGCATTPDTPVRVVVVTAVTTEQARPALGPTASAAVRSAADSDRGTFGLVVAGAPDASRTDDLVARRGTAVEHGPKRAGELDALVARATTAASGAAPPAGSPDLLHAIADGARGTPGTLVVADSGITTTDPLDLRRIGWEADPAAVAADLKARDALPDLTGWSVVFSGLGRVSGVQPGLGIPQQRWLERLWTAICQGGGARSCAIDPVLDPPAAVTAGTRAAPVVPVPATVTRELSGGSVEITLPDSRLGFAAGAATLEPGSDDALAPVVAHYRGAPYRVTVEGFVAFWGDDAYRAALSTARARTVAARLVALGVAPADITAVGRGAADGPDASTTAGTFDEQKVLASGIRRVVVHLDPSQKA